VANIKTTTDYYPFGMPMPGRSRTGQKYMTETTTTETEIHNSNMDAPTVGVYGPSAAQRRMTYDGWYPGYSSFINHEVQSGSDKWLKVESQDCAYGMHQVVNVSLSTSYTLSYEVNLGTATSVKVDIYNANSSGVPVGSPTTYTIGSTGTGSISHSTGATYNKLYIVIHQSDCGVTKRFYIDDVQLYKSGPSYVLNSNFTSPTVTGTQVTSFKNTFDGWYPFDYSELYLENESGSDNRMKTYTTVSNHGAQQYFNVTANQTYTISMDIDMGNAGSVTIYVADVTSTGSVINWRTVATTTTSQNLSGTFSTPYNRVQFQVRRTSNNTPVYFYMDNIRIYSSVTTVSQVAIGEDLYRFGYNGKEKINEAYGEGNLYDYGFRIYDPRIGRFLSVDPLAKSYPWYTPYQFAGNKPIIAIDLDGLEEYYVVRWVDAKGSHYKSEITLRKAGENEGSPNIDQRIPENTGNKQAVIIYRLIGSNDVIKSEFGDLNKPESEAQFIKVSGNSKKTYENLAGDKYKPFSVWEANVNMPIEHPPILLRA